MFTGIIETTGTVATVENEGTNLNFYIDSPITEELNVDQSVAHNGVCLTVAAKNEGQYKVTAVAETLDKTNLNKLKPGDIINLERALRVGDRLDGHFVQGHVDTTGVCIERRDLDGSWLYRFGFHSQFAKLIIEKGSVCVNGVSLTAFNTGNDEFTVTIIPYTYAHTNFSSIQKGTLVNLEFDVLGKYILGSLK